MPRNDWYRQCVIWRASSQGAGIETMTTWLPDVSGLHIGVRVRVRDRKSDPWSEGWQVSQIGERKPGSLVEFDEDEYRHHRKKTDI